MNSLNRSVWSCPSCGNCGVTLLQHLLLCQTHCVFQPGLGVIIKQCIHPHLTPLIDATLLVHVDFALLGASFVPPAPELVNLVRHQTLVNPALSSRKREHHRRSRKYWEGHVHQMKDGNSEVLVLTCFRCVQGFPLGFLNSSFNFVL